MITQRWLVSISHLRHFLRSLPFFHLRKASTPATQRPFQPTCKKMDVNDALSMLRTRRWSSRKKVWNHISNGRNKPATTTPKNDSDDGDTTTPSTSGSSLPPSPTDAVGPLPPTRSAPHPPTAFQVLTWNIDFMQSGGYARTLAALNHIQHEVFDCKNGEEPAPCVILLQEIHPASLPAILEHAWVRDHFLAVPVKATAWPTTSYGNVTLVSRTIPVTSAQMLTFWNSSMGRHAVAVDLRVSASAKTEGGSRSRSRPREVTLRVANVHLESLPYGVAMRPAQLAATAELLRADGIHAGIVCGDMNAIRAEDGDIHEKAGLLDAWTEGDEDEEGFTWGYQPACKFPAGRLDKILYTSGELCQVDKPRRVGVGLKTATGLWVSDHYGLVTWVRVKA